MADLFVIINEETGEKLCSNDCRRIAEEDVEILKGRGIKAAVYGRLSSVEEEIDDA